MNDAKGDLFNQPPERGDLDLWRSDPVARAFATGADQRLLLAYGERLGVRDMREAAREAERNLPRLLSVDKGGRRLDEIRFHPSYHRLMEEGISAGYVACAWSGNPGGHVTHSGLVYLTSQVEPGVCCPMTMSYAAVPALQAEPRIAETWRPGLVSRTYDPRAIDAREKGGLTLGMAMTERQGGSDVSANTTRAVPDGDGYRLTGHKWFCSAPMSDGFLSLAQAGGGLTCFLVPRWLPDSRNAIRITRLKDKLGNRANASAEIDYIGAYALRLGEEGDGVRTIIEMVHHTRLDTAIAPAGFMRAALTEAHHWVARRRAFGDLLIDQPLMRTVLADLVVDWAGAAALAFRVARAFDDTEGAAFARLAVALAKFLNNKLCPGVVAEAMEIQGGMGFVEDTPMPMLYREAPLNGIWEGSGNVIALDILRTITKVSDAGEALLAELEAARGTDRRYDAALTQWMDRRGTPGESDARAFAEGTARLLTASTLIQSGDAAWADGYCATRLGEGRGMSYGTARGLDERTLIAALGPPD